jgi:hypothetical protein
MHDTEKQVDRELGIEGAMIMQAGLATTVFSISTYIPSIPHVA